MLSWACAFSCLPTAGVNFGGVGGREDTFRKLNFVAGGSPKKYINAKLNKNEQTNDEHDKTNDQSHIHVGKTVLYEETSDDRKIIAMTTIMIFPIEI